MRTILALLLLSALCTAPLARAQDPAPSPPTTATPSEEAAAEEEEEEEDEIFRPSEEINVDSSVSFPVDI